MDPILVPVCETCKIGLVIPVETPETEREEKEPGLATHVSADPLYERTWPAVVGAANQDNPAPDPPDKRIEFRDPIVGGNFHLYAALRAEVSIVTRSGVEGVFGDPEGGGETFEAPIASTPFA